MPASESDPRSSTRPAAASPQPAAAGASTKRTLEEVVNDLLEYICNRFGNPSDFELLIREFISLIPTSYKG